MLSTRWYNAIVFAFWLAMMSWLLAAKVVPSLLVGEPPSYRAIMAAEAREAEPIPTVWQLSWDQRPIGWALTQTRVEPDELTEFRSRVHLANLSFAQVGPLRLGVLLGSPANVAIELDATSSVAVDPLGRLSGFWSRLSLAGIADLIRIRGTVSDSELELEVRSGEFVNRTRTTLAADALVGDGLAPTARLPKLRAGQAWSVPIFSPFRPPNQPLEILQARVEREEIVVWGGRAVRCRLVVYRSDDGGGSSFAREPQGRVWVHDDGAVLKQELLVMGSWLEFVRLDRRQGAAFLEAHHQQVGTAADNWRLDDPAPLSHD